MLFHPSGLPHAERLGIPWWAQGIGLIAVLAIGIWLLLDARADRADGAGESAARPDERPSEAASPARERLVRAEAMASSLARRAPIRTVDPDAAGVSPSRLLVLLAGFAAGWLALDRVRAVEALASFLRTDGAARVSQLGFCFAALLWAGAALAPVAPRGSALAFAVAAAIAGFLATASSWEERLEWWGATGTLQEWPDRWLWAGAALLLAGLTLVAGRYRPRRAVTLIRATRRRGARMSRPRSTTSLPPD